jgi:hypothetical protein
MPSIVTSIIGGIQGASAAKKAANALSTAYGQAGSTVVNAANEVNPWITNAARDAAGNVIGAGATAGQNVVNAANAGTATLNPYTTGGSTAENYLTGALAPGGQLNTPFTAETMAKMSPGYQFQLAQGQQGLQRQMAAAGLTGSGGALKEAMRYNQTYAGTAYNNAFQQYTAQNQNLFNNLNAQAQQGQQAAQFGAGLNTGASEWAGQAGIGTQEWGNNLNYGAATTTAQNLLSAENYRANTQVGAGNALAQGYTGAANAWNQTLGAIGMAGNALAVGGMGSPWSPSSSWSLSNLPYNMGWGR